MVEPILKLDKVHENFDADLRLLVNAANRYFRHLEGHGLVFYYLERIVSNHIHANSRKE